MACEWRVVWDASSNISFSGDSGWEEWDEPDDTIEEVEARLYEGENHPSWAMEAALEASGFNYWVEVREIGSGN